jgi:amidase
MGMRFGLMAAGIAATVLAWPAAAAVYDPAEKTIAQLQADMTAGRVNAEALVRAYLGRIGRLDRAGPRLQSVIALNPSALADARALDAERRSKGPRGPLHGIPILIKDNIETKDAMPTTAGSLALKDNVTRRDAPLVARLRAAGAIILGKTNLSEWANIRSTASISGWSAVGGLTRNPYVLDRNACGSSSGSGSATAASLAAAAIGTETDGSVTCPGSINGIVGLKPTVGLVSRTHVVPISVSQDTPGPMARSVADAAVLLTAMAGSDPADPATAAANAHRTDYVAALRGASLKGLRLGVFRTGGGAGASADRIFAQAVTAMRAAGATVVELPKLTVPDSVGDDELKVLLTELKTGMNAYLATTTAKTRTLADVIAFDKATPRETVLFGQELFEQAEATKGDSEKARARNRDYARAAIDKALKDHKLDALITPTTSPSWRVDVVRGDNIAGESSTLPAIAGYPHLTVPMGYVRGLPVGISFIGAAWSDAKLLRIGSAYEQASHVRRPPKFVPSLETAPDGERALSPAGQLTPK